jgi:glycosyltransferase involved in cell wall biosynthesis
MKILLLSRYSRMGASSRYRSHQYVPLLQEQGCKITVSPLLDDKYLQCLFRGQPVPLCNVIRAYGRRLVELLQASCYDIIWLEYEALPWLPAWMEKLLFRTQIPYVVDYDDAIFHRYDQHTLRVVRRLLGTKIDRVMRNAALVIAGNEYLATRAQHAGAVRIELLPTVIDLNAYPLGPQPVNSVFTLGWIGSPITAQYLKHIHSALIEVCRNNEVRIVAIGAKSLDLQGVRIENKSWSETTEGRDLQQFDVGIMPLPDSLWERGKCGLKLIQYMASARPVIGSPVGVNREIIDDGINGFYATSPADWIRAVQTLKHDKTLRQQMGTMGRLKVEQHYCLQVTAPKLLQLLHETKASRYVRH